MVFDRMRFGLVFQFVLFTMVCAVSMAPFHVVAKPGFCDDCILTLQLENDYFGNSDQHFSQGARIAVLVPAKLAPDWVKDTMSRLPWVDAGTSKQLVFSLGQSIFTPDDLSRSDLIVNERPYAGWLYGGIGLTWVDKDSFDNLELDIGIVGPSSYAEDVQKTWHEWFDFQRPLGWAHQIRDEPGIVLTYEHKWRGFYPFSPFGLDGDITPHVGASLGNVLTQAAAGLTFRIGSDLKNNLDYGPPRIRPSLPGSDYFNKDGDWSWYVFAGVEGRGVLRNIFLDGNTFRDSHSVDKKPFVGDVQAGLAVIIGRVRMAYTHVFRSKEFDEQDDHDQFGAVSLSFRF
jgi:hypothetical protein